MKCFVFPKFPVTVQRNHPREKFSAAEDEKLRKLVETYGDKDWPSVAEHMPNRNVRQCRDRWVNYLSGRNTNRPWTTEEDDLLLELRGKYGSSWVTIAKHFEGRNDIAIKNRYNVLIRRSKRMLSEANMAAASVATPEPIEVKKKDESRELTVEDCVLEGLFDDPYPWEGMCMF